MRSTELQQNAQRIRDKICDTAGFYAEFAVADVIDWLKDTPEQQIRDNLRALTREGLIERIGSGRYKWKSNRTAGESK